MQPSTPAPAGAEQAGGGQAGGGQAGGELPRSTVRRRAHMGAIPPAADDLRAEVTVLRKVVGELITKHNFLLNDANSAFLTVEKGLLAHEDGFKEHERKLGVTESVVLDLDQRVASCDVWLKALSQDMSDGVKAMFVEADKKAALVMQQVEGIDKALMALDVDSRLQALEKGLGPAILGHIEGSLNRDLSRSIEAMAKTAVESTDGAAMGRIAAGHQDRGPRLRPEGGRHSPRGHPQGRPAPAGRREDPV